MCPTVDKQQASLLVDPSSTVERGQAVSAEYRHVRHRLTNMSKMM
jgi:hypothetical protein